MLVVGDRRAAIRAAVDAVWARGRATVAVVGKGHESGQDVGGVVHPFDDRAELGAALRRAAGRAPRDRTVAPEVARATGGSVVAPPGVDPDGLVVDGPVVTDSREAGPGGLYVARVGEHADGHDFVAAAVERGAVAALVTRARRGRAVRRRRRHPGGLRRAGPRGGAPPARPGRRRHHRLVGEDQHQGPPGHGARHGRADRGAGRVLQLRGGRAAHRCRVTADTRFLVVEMGARGIGHIAYLARMAPPRIGVVLNVGTAHVGEFGSREAIATAKSELVAALPADGLAVLNADDPAVRAMAR